MSIRKAKNFLTWMLSIEEQWDTVVQNYIEFEQDMLREAVNSMVVLHHDYNDFQDIRLGFARRLSNLLSSCKSYIHHTPQHLKKVIGEDSKSKFGEFTNMAYDKFFGYRFMEALRNHAQHHGLPIDRAAFGSRWINDENNQREGLRHHVAAGISLEKLQKNTKFKKAILNEISPDNTIINLVPLIREHMEALGFVHDSIRKLISNEFNESRLILRTAIEEYENVNGGNSIGLCAYHITDCEEDSTKVYIIDEVIIRIEQLMTRNGSLANFTKRYVTNEL